MEEFILNKYFLTKLIVDFEFPDEEEYSVSAVETGLDYKIFRHPKDQLRRMMELSVEIRSLDSNERKVGHQIFTVINGDFTLPKDNQVKDTEMLFRINALSVLYSTLRGVLGNLTGSFPGEKFVLDAIVPQDAVKNIEKFKKEEKKRRKRK